MTTSEKPQQFTCLPRQRYVDDGWFERDMNEVISRQWIYFGHESQIANVGDVLVREICDESIFATRDQTGTVNAFFNVCRHRGSRICDPGPSNTKHLVCPYHRWSYGLDGRLTGAPSMKDGVDFEFEDFGLRRAPVELWRGFIFVSVGLEPPARSLAAGFADIAADVDSYEPERLKVAHHADYEIAANWKLVAENWWECYHCQGSHPELCAVIDTRGLDEILGDLDFMSDELWSACPDLGPGVESFTISGEPACKRRLGSAKGGRKCAFGIHPTLTNVALCVDHAVVHEILPVNTGLTRMTTQWLVHADAVEGKDYDVAELTAIWQATNLQDVELCERNQLGVRSRSYLPGPNSVRREPAIRATLAAYHRLLGESEQFEALTGRPL